MRYFFTLPFLLLLAPVVFPQEPVRLGIFSLFNIQVIQAEAVDRPLTVGRDQEASLNLSLGQTLVAERHGGGLQCSIVDRTGRVVATWHGAQLTLGDSPAAVRLTIPGKIARSFRGRVTLSPARRAPSPPVTGIRAVLESDPEAVVGAVTAAEMPATDAAAALEAFKAQAVVVRTYMASHPSRHAAEGFDFCDSTHCQLYQGEDHTDLTGEPNHLAYRAAAETRGVLLTFRGAPVEAYFTPLCGGVTATPELAWGAAAAGPYRHESVRCDWCRDSRRYRWQRTVAAGKFFAALGAALNFRPSAHARLRLDESGGFVRAVAVTDGTRRAVLPVARLRHTIGRRLGWNLVISNAFSLERRGGEFLLRGRGFGHNVGLCVEGALGQARAGRAWRSILSFYFPGAEIGGMETGGSSQQLE